MSRFREDQGMTLVELLVAMAIIALGVSALVAGLGGGILAVQRSAKASTAGALADQQMEAYRNLSFSSIATDTTATSSADSVYTGDSAYSSSWKITAACPGSQTCNPSRPVTGSDGAKYRIDSYVLWACGISSATLGGTVSAPTCSGTPASSPVKQVTIVVRDALNTSRDLTRVTSTFDALTG